MSRLVAVLAWHPRLVLGAIFALTAPALYFASGVVLDSSPERLVQQSEPAARYYAEVRDLFGKEEVDAVVIVAEDVYRPATLDKIRRLDTRLAAVAGVERVESLASLEVVRSGADGSLEYGSPIPAAPEESNDVATIVRDNPLLRPFVSKDGRAAMLVVTYRTMSDHEFVESGIVERVKAILADERGPEELHLIGSPSLRVAAARTMSSDMNVFVPVSTLTIALVLFVCFRSLRGVVVPLVTVGIGIIWMVGLMGFLGVPIDIVGLLLPSLLLAIGSVYATHIVAAYYDEAQQGGSRPEIVTRILGHVGPPVIVTAFTTLVGFAALAAYRIPAIRSFGGFASFGVAALFVLSLTFTPALLAVLPLPRRRGATVEREWPWLRRLLDGLAEFDERRRAPLLVGSAVLVGALALGIPRIEFDTDFSRYFPEGSAEQLAVAASNEHLGGNINFLVAVDTADGSTLTGLAELRRLEALQRFVAEMAGMTATSSIVDVVKLANRALHEDDPAKLVLPDADDAVQQLLLLVPPEATERFLLPDASRAIIRVRSSVQNSTALADALTRIEARGAELFGAGVTVRTTGAIPLMYGAADRLASGQVASLVIALAFIFLTMAGYFASVRLGLVAMLPNLLPIVLYFGVLGWAGIPISLSTALIASVALGLGVDEAIHLLSEFNRGLRVHGDQRRAISEAMATTGPPVVFTTLALTAGFATQVLSGFAPIQQFGYLTALNIGASLLADLFLMPAFVSIVRFGRVAERPATASLGRTWHRLTETGALSPKGDQT